MATFEIVTKSAPYYTVRVSFKNQQFDQQVVSAKTGKALTTELQAYADEYERAHAALPQAGD
jgi:hypothetical protein